jgi:hypothetical protein
LKLNAFRESVVGAVCSGSCEASCDLNISSWEHPFADGTAVAIVRNTPVKWREIQLQGDDSMSDELKKNPQTPEVESTELSGKDLEKVEGGVSLNYGQIEWTYTQQKRDGGTEDTKK